MLIADEIHDGEGQLCLFLGVDLSRHECLSLRLDWPDAGLTVDDWQQWSKEWTSRIGERVSLAEQRMKSSVGKSWSKELKHLRDIKRKLDRLSGMQADDGWILNEQEVQGKSTTGVRFDPLSPARYAEQVLWRGVDKIVLVSATVRPKTVELLGIKPDEMEFCEYGSSFDPKRRPVIFVPTVRMDYRTEQDDHAMRWMLNKVDDLIEARLDRKGIIHAVSYNRSRFIVDNSRHRGIMLTHNKHDKMAVIERFRQSEPPCILVSPSVDTGFDFAGSQARYQLLIKIPFVSKQDRVIAARSKLDKEYPNYLAAQTLVQATGRIVRSVDDYGESILTDSHAEWFIPKIRKFLPKWWLESYRICDGALPEPLNFGEPDGLATAALPEEVCSWCNETHAGGPEACK
jgi:Rad3-related DNA helicase